MMRLFGFVWIASSFLSTSNAYVPVTKVSYSRNRIYGSHEDFMKNTILGKTFEESSYRHYSNVMLSSKKRRRHENDDEMILKKRIAKVWRDVLEQEMDSPANNPNLSPVEFVSKILECLLQPDDPLPNSGYRVLLRSSSPKWRREIQKALGVPSQYYSDENLVNEDILASALGSALMRPNNQFGILVNNDDDYTLQIVNILDYQDGTCWISSRLVSSSTLESKVLVILGWHLIKPPNMDTWTIDSIEWQDFRDAYRPGIGREEWSQIFDN